MRTLTAIPKAAWIARCAVALRGQAPIEPTEAIGIATQSWRHASLLRPEDVAVLLAHKVMPGRFGKAGSAT